MAFVDTSGFYAALDANDPQHEDALDQFHRAESEGWALITHSYILQETWALVQSRLGWMPSINGREYSCSDARLFGWTSPLHALGAARCRQARERQLSLTDCGSLELMFREDLRQVIGYDEHLTPSA